METPLQKPQNKWDLIFGIGFILFGCYRLYNRFINDAEISSFRIILAIGFVGLGLYNIYKYIKAGDA